MFLNDAISSRVSTITKRGIQLLFQGIYLLAGRAAVHVDRNCHFAGAPGDISILWWLRRDEICLHMLILNFVRFSEQLGGEGKD